MAKSKVAQEKERMGWTKDSPKCGNCKYYSSRMEKVKYEYSNQTWSVEKDKRCSLGEFATNVSFCCDEWKRRGED